jgi:beta-glucanase (GH16 family)
MARLAIAGVALFGLAACEPQLPGTPQPTNTGPGNVTTTTQPTNGTTTPANTAPAGWRYVGGDEFDGTSVNTAKWKPYYNTYGDANHELECNQPSNATVSGGALDIQARKQTVVCPGGATRNYTSAFLGSRETGTYYPKYARFEMRAKLPHAQGMWPAFWLRHKDGAGVAEVDIMEYFHSQVPGKATQTLHLDGRTNLSKKTTAFEAPTLNPGWHTWAVEIAPATGGVKFTFYVDGAAVHSYVDTQHHWANSSPDAGTWDIALNMAIGGNWVGGPDSALGVLPNVGRCSIGGTYASGCTTAGIKRVDWNNNASDSYKVDYVRVYVPR